VVGLSYAIEGMRPAGGVYKLELFLPEDYPMAAPKVRTEVDRADIGSRILNAVHRIQVPRCPAGTIFNKNLSSEHRQTGPHLLRHPEGQVEPSPADSDSLAQVTPHIPRRAHPWDKVFGFTLVDVQCACISFFSNCMAGLFEIQI
jgi:hypothetical protein